MIFRYATEVDVDFVRKSVRAIGRCAIKVEQSAERCVSTLLDLKPLLQLFVTMSNPIPIISFNLERNIEEDWEKDI